MQLEIVTRGAMISFNIWLFQLWLAFIAPLYNVCLLLFNSPSRFYNVKMDILHAAGFLACTIGEANYRSFHTFVTTT